MICKSRMVLAAPGPLLDVEVDLNAAALAAASPTLLFSDW
jgi:hypothetical protein